LPPRFVVTRLRKTSTAAAIHYQCWIGIRAQIQRRRVCRCLGQSLIRVIGRANLRVLEARPGLTFGVSSVAIRIRRAATTGSGRPVAAPSRPVTALAILPSTPVAGCRLAGRRHRAGWFVNARHFQRPILKRQRLFAYRDGFVKRRKPEHFHLHIPRTWS
jgi:hypothetical protein